MLVGVTESFWEVLGPNSSVDGGVDGLESITPFFFLGTFGSLGSLESGWSGTFLGFWAPVVTLDFLYWMSSAGMCGLDWGRLPWYLFV